MFNSNDDFTLFVGNLSDKVDETLLYELFLQAGPVESVKRPTESNGKKRSYAFVKFKHQCSLLYTIDLMAGTCLYNRQLRLQLRTNHQQQPISCQTWNDGFGPVRNNWIDDSRMRPYNRKPKPEMQTNEFHENFHIGTPIVSFKTSRDEKRRNDHHHKYDHRKGKIASGNYRGRDQQRNNRHNGKNNFNRMNPY